MRGFHNIALRIDVSQKAFEIERIPDSVLKQTLGGKGLATHLLLKYNPPGVDPLEPDNHLIFAIGPVTRTALGGSCRHGVYTKSPLTGGYAESYPGGTAAGHMAAAGADAVLMHGISPEPIWLEIAENSVQFHSAADLWGLDRHGTEGRIRSWLKKYRPEAKTAGVASIGPAGEEKAVRAVIGNDYWRGAGRAGAGAVMGSKKIKAIAFYGSRAKQVADPDRMNAFARGIRAAAAARGPEGRALHVKGLEPSQIEDKAKAEWEDRLTLFDTLIICRFYRDLYQWEQLSTIITAATGMKLNVAQMRAIAARVSDDARRFNFREGLTSADDRLPVRLPAEPLPESQGIRSSQAMEQLLKEYHTARGLDADGRPPNP